MRNKKVINFTVDHVTENSTEKKRGSLLQCIGSKNRPAVEHSKVFPLEKGDIILLCTDGVWDAIDPGKLASCCNGFTTRSAVRKLLKRAEAARPDTADNMTVLLLKWNEPATEMPGTQNEGRAFVDQDWLWDCLIRGKTDYRKLEKTNPSASAAKPFKQLRASPARNVGKS